MTTEKSVSQLHQEIKPKHIFGIVVVGVVWFMFFGMNTSPTPSTSTPSQPTPSAQPAQNVVSPEAKENARKELDELMDLSTKAGLVTSYEFSDKATVVFVGSTWYTQQVSFKKDFMAKIAMLKKTITGYQHYELHDAYSDETVAKVTAFSGALEVYK